MIIHSGGRRMGPARRYGLHVAGQLWYAAWQNRNRQLTQQAYPGQPATRTRPPTKPCTCRYHRMRWVLPIPFIETENHTVIDVLSVRGFSWFTINPDCPHHGRQVLILNPALPAELTIEALWNDPTLNVMRDPYDLDDDERRGS